MPAVIYRFRLKPGKEKEYQKSWHKLATYFVKNCGAIGSCLHKGESDLWVAYSRWPNQKTRDKAFPQGKNVAKDLPEEIQQAMKIMKQCVKRKLPEICTEVVDDLLIN